MIMISNKFRHGLSGMLAGCVAFLFFQMCGVFEFKRMDSASLLRVAGKDRRIHRPHLILAKMFTLLLVLSFYKREAVPDPLCPPCRQMPKTAVTFTSPLPLDERGLV